MRVLVAAMKPGRRLTFQEVTNTCRTEGVFLGLVGDSEIAMTTAHRSGFGKVLGRYADRLVSNAKFIIEGKGHGRRYRVEVTQPEMHGRTVVHGVTPELLKTQKPSLVEKTVRDRATVQTPHRDKFTPEGRTANIKASTTKATRRV